MLNIIFDILVFLSKRNYILLALIQKRRRKYNLERHSRTYFRIVNMPLIVVDSFVIFSVRFSSFQGASFLCSKFFLQKEYKKKFATENATVNVAFGKMPQLNII